MRGMTVVLMAGLVVVGVACGDDGGPSSTTAAVTTAAITSAPVATSDAAATTVGVDQGSAVIAGTPLTIGGQFVQYEALSGMWRLLLTGPGHSCAEELGSVEIGIGVDLEAADASTPPDLAKVPVGVVFRRVSDAGPLTTTVGVTLHLDAMPVEPGARWTGRLAVAAFTDDSGATYSVEAPLSAEVCPAV